jgi:hypothetical protein
MVTKLSVIIFLHFAGILSGRCMYWFSSAYVTVILEFSIHLLLSFLIPSIIQFGFLFWGEELTCS